MKTLIVGSGSVSDESLLIRYHQWADLVIAADGGQMHLKKAGLNSHVLLGDFDSINASELAEIKAHNSVELITFPKDKDYTDLELAINLAIERGASKIVLLGASGTRLDHTTANIHLLYKLVENNIEGYIEDEHNRIYLINKALTIEKQADCKVSILPLPPLAKGVSTKGLTYKLFEADLPFGIGLGISNEFSEQTATISVKDGLLLVFISKD
ncbi:MAG: thiamine diphosphokinase [Acetivibrionales bacterium]|jgi:thiamine pyrophosphokinase|nr:thiamine diphosphokinase [Clostridiaceae bacterium]